MKRALLGIIVCALYVLHQDFWFWRTANPLVFGFIPVGLFYHSCYTVVVAVVLWMLVRQAWPRELEEGLGDGTIGREGEGATGRRGDRPMSPAHPLAPSPSRPLAPSPPRPLVSSEETDDR